MKRLSWYTVKQTVLLFVTTFAQSALLLPTHIQEDACATQKLHCQ